MPMRPESHKTHDAKAYDLARREDHRFYTTTWWKKTREFVIARDEGICRMCANAAGTVCDHYLSRRSRPDLENNVDNLWLLCIKCDAIKRNEEMKHDRVAPGMVFLAPECKE